MPDLYRLTHVGRPVSQKNKKRVVPGINHPVTDPQVRKWRQGAAKSFGGEWGSRPPIRVKGSAVLVVSYLHPRQVIDADNLLAAPLDALQEAGVVLNDRVFDLVVSERRLKSDRPRVEVFIAVPGPGEKLRPMARILLGIEDANV